MGYPLAPSLDNVFFVYHEQKIGWNFVPSNIDHFTIKVKALVVLTLDHYHYKQEPNMENLSEVFSIVVN